MDFLIREPVRTVLLYKGGIPVTVPAPERYSIHKLIVATQRKSDPLKIAKDIAQAEQIILAMLPRRRFALAEAWIEAWERGPHWQVAMAQGLSLMSDAVREPFRAALTEEVWMAKVKPAARKPREKSVNRPKKTPKA